jgi:hypothetical protein
VSRSESAPSDSAANEFFPPEHIIDSFFIGDRHLAEREWRVAVDAAGNLQALPPIRLDNSDLSAAIQTELAFSDMVGGRRRLIEAAEFFLFRLELLEQPAGTPGWNDPIYLYGTLYGPFPTAGQAVGIEGQLAITRGDLLEGLIQSAEYAFRYCRSVALKDGTEPPPRCFHLSLPGDREEDLQRGLGIVLAYPLLPAELILTGVSNEIVVKQLLHDTLSALKDDLARERIAHPLCSTTLPVPSRFMLEQQLLAEGYSIKGDAAVKKTAAGEGFKGFLAGVFGSLMSERLDLPPEADVDQFLNIASKVLNTLPGWPTPRAVALRNRVKPAPAESFRNNARRRPAQPTQIRTPQPGESAQRLQLRQVRQTGAPPDWMRDFIAAHQQPNAAPAKLTSTFGLRPDTLRNTDSSDASPQGSLSKQGPKRKTDGKPASASNFTPGSTSGSTPEWMQDFDDPSGRARPNDSKKPAPSSKPEWLKDFE